VEVIDSGSQEITEKSTQMDKTKMAYQVWETIKENWRTILTRTLDQSNDFFRIRIRNSQEEKSKKSRKATSKVFTKNKKKDA
jgi:hypothetical protein